uniref:E3 ubiquitin-protein ligase RNF213-like n=1 Tax=Callospermophilus lateralis TaxID=76772 RepID=UPI0040389A17
MLIVLVIFSGTDEKLLANITEDAKRLMAAASSVFTEVAGDVLNGSILVRRLELILKHKSQFLDLWQLETESSSFQEKNCDMEETLDWRMGEVMFLMRAKRQVDSLLRLCGKVKHLIQVDFGEIEARHSEDLNYKRLNEAMRVRQPASSACKLMTHYNLDREVQRMAARIDLLMDSHIFQVFWEEAAESLSHLQGESERQTLALLEAYEYLYSPCYQRFMKLFQDLKSGEITFGDINVFFKDFVDKYNDLTLDLQIMCEVDPQAQRGWISERVEQIKEYYSLHQAISSAKVILQFKKDFGLTGDFSVIYTLINFIDDFKATHHERLNQISPQLIQAKKLLQDISESRRQCLEELALQKELVSWLHDELRGITELKVFVDLASISAGESDIDVDRVACFHVAAQGYASLLYKLDKKADFRKFMEILRELWKALQNDPHLPSKLRDSARNLEWLKTVKKSHGSIEQSSLSLATAINSRGIYEIRASTSDHKISPDAILHLILPGGHSGLEPERSYTLEELKDLLNKLMLMSGKKDHKNMEVERFSQLFCYVQRLMQAFLNLYSAGNMLFRTWTAEVYCCPRNGISICMDFHLELVSQLTESGDVTQLLEALCRQMEHFLEDWKELVSRKHREHFYLNFYTAEQLVLLSTELRKQSPSEATLMMLSFIKVNCTPADVLKATKGFNEAPRHHVRTVMEKLPPLQSAEISLVTKLRAIMEQSLESMSVFLPGCLVLEALGHCLARLATMSGPPVERSLPMGLQAGQPNLVLCGHSEVLLATLAIYMQAPGQPLPTFDEVLLCTPGTTFEEVALFLHCCLAPVSQGHNCYSLLFADQLSYEVASQAEALFRSLCTQCPREDYQLVVVCVAAQECCYLPSAFSQYKVHLIPQAPLHAIQDYLAHHYQVPAQTCRWQLCSETGWKSLYVKRLHEKLKKKLNSEKVPLKIVRLTDTQVDEGRILGSLLSFWDAQFRKTPMIFHFDVTASNSHALQFSFLDIFPRVTCRPPKEVIAMELSPERSFIEPGTDEREFSSTTFQRPYQYLKRFHQKQNLDTFQYQAGSVEGTLGECIQHLLIYCGVINPSWSELQNFARFLNCQLKDCEACMFCNPGFPGFTLPGFKNFVVTFMIFMARDFATPTLHISDQSPGKHMVTMDGVDEEELTPFTLWRRWESEPHPYVFFNGDHETMTFIGFHLRPNENGSVDAINHLNGEIIRKDVMTEELYKGLLLQRVPFNVDFDNLPRHKKLLRLCQSLGIPQALDPDETYEVTTDNMLKILAIEMRFRCGIPVIIMGETGCGKTRLIKFLCDLWRAGTQTETMKLVKVHGGTTTAMIHSKVLEAEKTALYDKDQHQLDTILFFDEANTTEAISCIKEILCDQTVDGKPLEKDSGLHIIAVCNPYRKHSQETICCLESAGLGYRVSAEETADRLGSIPLRQLVYRVHALPLSLIPLVWDFGQLNDTAEKLYIQQIVQRLVDHVRISEDETHVITEVHSVSQRFMRNTESECSFVILRDVERCVKVFTWFHGRSEMLLVKLNTFLCETSVSKNNFRRDPVLLSLVMAVGVCYHASLKEKESYRRAICRYFPEPYDNSGVILDEITHAQDLFLSGVPLRKTIAKNLALKENVFMMIICIELKIHLFLVGKPGTSKSLSKTIVADAMQGQAAHSALFRSLKQVHLVSFQCSPHCTPQGIVNTFKQCARFQQGKDLQQYVSVVVLDEVGLAEDSPKMPLKALHPLLEDGCIEGDPAPHQKVGFIGISNWALDPAKMNRGIFVSRDSPSEKELIENARGICSSDSLVQDRVRGYFAPFAKAYETVCSRQNKEFFGLRDYYSLIKMVFATARASNMKPSPQDIAQAVLRNFSGKDDIPALDIFMASLPEAGCVEEVSTLELIKQNICGSMQNILPAVGEPEEAESRYLLILTQNYVALQILQQSFFSEDQQPEIIFGSSFPWDQEYTQICRNINRHLYESLYDALSQYYVYLGGQKYVDLGLGTHRVKCWVHPDFRVIVIEEKNVVYEQFPVPLINRLEKHYLDLSLVLQGWQKSIVQELMQWAEQFADVKAHQFLAGHKYSPADVFIGYHSDACASVVLQAVERQGPGDLTQELYHRVSEEAKLILLDCDTPDAVVRLSTSTLGSFAAQTLSQEYWNKQQHHSFADFLQAQLHNADLERHAIFTEVTTFSRLLTNCDCEALGAEVKGLAPKPVILSLQQFDTEYSFPKEVRSSLMKTDRHKILIVQMDFDDGTHSAQLIASAKYSAINEINKIQGTQGCVFFYFITKLSRMRNRASYMGFHGGLWQSVHIDDLRRSTVMAADVTKLQSVTISQLFMPGGSPKSKGNQEEVMEAETSKSGEVAEMEMEKEVSEELEWDTADLRGSEVSSPLFPCWLQVADLEKHRQLCQPAFLRISKMRLSFLLKKQEENQLCSLKEWVGREAANQDVLQEAGTFRHPLWKRVQGTVTPLLASMISLIDRDGNLELLIRPGSPAWARDLWMYLFSNTKLLNIPLVMNNIRSKSEMSSIVVQNHMSLPEGACNSVPFSWRIRDYVEELWVQAQYIIDVKGRSDKLVEIFQQTPLGMFLAKLPGEQQQELVQCYLRDFLLFTMRVSTWEELKVDVLAAMACAEMLIRDTLKPSPQAWLQLVKKLSIPLELVCSDGTQWSHVFSIALFVEHVLLGTGSQIPELGQLVTKYVFSLDKCVQENSDLKTHRPFEAVMTILCECKEQASKSLARVAIGKHAQFRQMCNSFFMDLVSTKCFKDSTPPQKSVIDELLSLLFVRKELLRHTPQRYWEHTKSLSPFDDAVDKTPVIRSVVLKLLLKYSFQAVKDYIQAYLSLLEKKAFITEDKTELYMLFINCLEEKTSAYSTRSELDCLREEGHFLQTCSSGRQGQGPATAASVEYLQELARTRLCLDRASDLLLEFQEGSELAEEQQCYLRHVQQFCTQAGKDWHHMYLVRTSLRGMEFVKSLSREGHRCQWVFPKGVIAQQKDHTGQMDQYLVHGDKYKALRDAVGKAMLECKVSGLEAALMACRSPGAQQAVYLLLALFREVAALHCSHNLNLHPKPEQCEAVSRFIEDSKILSPPGVRPFAASLVANTLPLLSAGPGADSLEGTVTEMAVHTAAVLLCGQSKVLVPLRNLAFSPASMVCGKLMEQSFCVDCGAKIGGINHRPHAGFQSIRDSTDRTKTGHVLGHPQPRDVIVVSDRDLSPVIFILMRLLTHLAMLLGATQNPKAVINIIKPPVSDPKGFLQQHIRRDLEQLTKMLGKSVDETTHVVHLMLCCLLKEQHPLPDWRHLNFDAKLSKKGHRNNWEKHVEALLLPELEHLDKTLLTVGALISQDERISSSPVAKIIYGDPASFLPQLPQKSVAHCSKIWSCRKKITVEYLQHVVEQKNGKEMVPVLWQFLQKVCLLHGLPPFSDGLRQLFHNRITIFLSTWNALRRSLETNGEIKLPKVYYNSELDLDTDFKVILPRRRGLGLCSTALVSYLINLHNEIIYTMEKFSKENNSYSVDASDVTDLHVVSYEVERDLMPLILSNCQYEVEQGGETSQEFDLEKIQRQISSHFLQGKPRLTLKGIPTLVYRHDWNFEHLFVDIKNKMAQSPLPNSAMGAISGELRSYSDVCEALSIIEVTLGFLGTAGGDPNMYLNVYVQDILRMSDQTTPVLKALSRCQLKHAIVLWQFLSAHKSEQLLRLKKDPFWEISSRYKADLSPEIAKLLSTFLNHTDLDAFLMELHELLVLKLRNTQARESFNPEWSLRDTLVSYMETKESEVLPEVESQFPEEILLASCVSVWKVAVARKQDQQAK